MDPTSHAFAAIADWAYPPSAEAMASLDYFERWVNSQRGKNAIPQRIPRPWMAPKPKVSKATGATDKGSAERRSRLAERFNLPKEPVE